MPAPRRLPSASALATAQEQLEQQQQQHSTRGTPDAAALEDPAPLLGHLRSFHASDIDMPVVANTAGVLSLADLAPNLTRVVLGPADPRAEASSLHGLAGADADVAMAALTAAAGEAAAQAALRWHSARAAAAAAHAQQQAQQQQFLQQHPLLQQQLAMQAANLQPAAANLNQQVAAAAAQAWAPGAPQGANNAAVAPGPAQQQRPQQPLPWVSLLLGLPWLEELHLSGAPGVLLSLELSRVEAAAKAAAAAAAAAAASDGGPRGAAAAAAAPPLPGAAAAVDAPALQLVHFTLLRLVHLGVHHVSGYPALQHLLGLLRHAPRVGQLELRHVCVGGGRQAAAPPPGGQEDAAAARAAAIARAGLGGSGGKGGAAAGGPEQAVLALRAHGAALRSVVLEVGCARATVTVAMSASLLSVTVARSRTVAPLTNKTSENWACAQGGDFGLCQQVMMDVAPLLPQVQRLVLRGQGMLGEQDVVECVQAVARERAARRQRPPRASLEARGRQRGDAAATGGWAQRQSAGRATEEEEGLRRLELPNCRQLDGARLEALLGGWCGWLHVQTTDFTDADALLRA